MREVLGRAAIMIGDGVRRVGVDPAPALATLGVDEARLREPTARIDWDRFLDFLETLEALCGGPAGWERVYAEAQPHVFTAFQPAFRFFVSPRASYHFVTRAMMPFVYSNVRFDIRNLSAGRVAITVEIPPPYRPSAAFWRGCAGGMRTQPRMLGLPDAVVVSDERERRAVFTIAPPASRTWIARLGRASRALLVDGVLAEMEASWRETLQHLAALEATSARLTDEIDARQRSEAALRAALDALPGCAFLVDPDGAVSPFDEVARDALRRDDGRLRVRLRGAAHGERDPELHAVAVGDAGKERHLVIRKDAARAYAARLGAVAASWALTPRQVEVVALVARGLANKEIAAALGCSPHTVELHVTEILRRARVSGRAELVAEFWAHLPAARTGRAG